MSIPVSSGHYSAPELIALAIKAAEQRHGINKAFPYTIELVQIHEDLLAVENAELEDFLRSIEQSFADERGRY
jgi:hypothetical protein